MLSTITSAQRPVAPTKSRQDMSSEVKEEEVEEEEEDKDKDEAKKNFKKKAITSEVQKRQGSKAMIMKTVEMKKEERMKVLTEGRRTKKEVYCSVALVTNACLCQ